MSSSGAPDGAGPGGGGPPADLPGLPVTDLQIYYGVTYVGVIATLCGISTLLVITRVVSRWRSTRIAIDDYFLIASSTLGIVEMSCLIAIVEPVISTRPKFLLFDSIGRNAPLTMIAEVCSSWSVALTKTSIALLLVRLQHARAWTIFLFIIIGIQVLSAVFITILQTTRCIPTEAIWNPNVIAAWCWSAEAFKATMTAVSSLVVATDAVFALMPLTFLHQIRSSLFHRIVIACLMGLGLFASAASIVKTVMVNRFDTGGDVSANGLAIALWASTESQVGIIAACIPCLRAPFLRLLARTGLHRPDAEHNPAWSIQELPMNNFGYAGLTVSGERAASDRPSSLTEVTPNLSQEVTLHSGRVSGEKTVRVAGKEEIHMKTDPG
ncbi:hypothetical protein QBC47DRAFT_348880 [Echria macrotheca]|uniref:Rhodopsin domain-containing protein n=1 Tax=Echria macrotheca TaxID=438768 RepID=A0AAJ0B7X1_9PEZI|nr:hypothetical protein QBC47DRAFT_348880 [Echria macrotheca]